MRARERELVWRATDGNARRTSAARPDARIAPRRDRRSKERRPCEARKVGLDRRVVARIQVASGAPSDKSRGHDRGVVFTCDRSRRGYASA